MTPRRNVLLIGLRDPDARVREQAALALDHLDLLESLSRILSELKDFSVARWVELLRSLAGVRDETCLKLALRALAEPAEEVQAAGLEAVAEMGDWRATAAVCRCLTAASAGIRARAANCLASLGDRRGAPQLLPLLEDPDKEVRAHAADALGALGHQPAEAALLVLAEDPAAEVRAAALGALGRIGLSSPVGGPPPG